jgi:hypothetical protein
MTSLAQNGSGWGSLFSTETRHFDPKFGITYVSINDQLPAELQRFMSGIPDRLFFVGGILL